MSKRFTIPILVIAAIIGALTAIYLNAPRQQRDFERTAAILSRSSETEDLHTTQPDEPDPSDTDATAVTSAPETEETSQRARFPIVGTVVDDQNNPIAGAEVLVYRPRRSDRAIEQLVCGDDGTFRSENLPLDFYQLEARAEAYGSNVVADVVPGGPSVTLVLEAGSVIEGRVFIGERPVPNATVFLAGIGHWPVLTTATDPSGFYRFGGLAAGDYTLHARSEHLASDLDDWARLEPAPEGGHATLVHDLWLLPGLPLRLTVLDSASSEPIGGAIVALATDPLAVFHLVQVTDEAGMATFEGMEPGRFFINVRSPAHFPLMGYEVIVPIGSVLSAVDVQIALERGGAVSGHVVDENGNPIPLAGLTAQVVTPNGARYRIRRNLLGGIHPMVRPDGARYWINSFGHVSDFEGAFQLQGLPTGALLLVAEARGYQPAILDGLSVELGEERTGLRVEMRRGHGLLVRVLGDGEVGLERAELTIWPASTERVSHSIKRKTDSDGLVRLRDLPDSFKALVRAEGYRDRTVTVIVGDLPEPELLIHLDPVVGRLRGRVLDPEGLPFAGVRVEGLGPKRSPHCVAETGTNGWFEVEGCGEPPYPLKAVPQGLPPWVRIVTDTDEPVEIALPRPATIEGELRSSDTGSLPDEATLEIVGNLADRSEYMVEFRLSLELPNTAFSWHELPPVPLRLRFSAPGYVTHETVVRPEPGSHNALGRIVLEPAGSIEGYVVDDLGGPVVKARVTTGAHSKRRQLWTNDDGYFYVGELDLGEHEIVAVHHIYGRGRATAIVSAEEPRNRVRIRLDQPTYSHDLKEIQEILATYGIIVEPEQLGLLVTDVIADSSASRAGLRRGIYLLEFPDENDGSGAIVFTDGESFYTYTPSH